MRRVLLGVSEEENVLTLLRECPRASGSDSLNKEEDLWLLKSLAGTVQPQGGATLRMKMAQMKD